MGGAELREAVMAGWSYKSMAIIAKEPERELVIELSKGVVILSPDMLSYEIANSLTKEDIS
jgi:hypothetical protein